MKSYPDLAADLLRLPVGSDAAYESDVRLKLSTRRGLVVLYARATKTIGDACGRVSVDCIGTIETLVSALPEATDWHLVRNEEPDGLVYWNVAHIPSMSAPDGAIAETVTAAEVEVHEERFGGRGWWPLFLEADDDAIGDAA